MNRTVAIPTITLFYTHQQDKIVFSFTCYS